MAEDSEVPGIDVRFGGLHEVLVFAGTTAGTGRVERGKKDEDDVVFFR